MRDFENAIKELEPDNLMNHVNSFGCAGGNGEPCVYNNGPASCLVACYGIGDCPFGQGEQRLDETYVSEMLDKLRAANASPEGLNVAMRNVALARAMVQEDQDAQNGCK